MTAIALHLSSSSARGSRADTAVGNDAETLRTLREGAFDFSNSISVGEVHRTTLENLRAAVEEAAAPDWYENGARPIEAATVGLALSFLKALPSAIPQPDIAVHPDGEIAFEWYEGPRSVLTVSIGPSGYLSYAALFGRSKAHGLEYFAEDLPQALLVNLSRLLSGGT